MTHTDPFTQHIRTMNAHRALIRSVECRFMSQVPLVPPILDIGAGDGHFASIAYDRPIDIGIDPLWSDLVEAAQRQGVYRMVSRADATCMPFADASFNTVISNCVIEHIPDNDATLREIGRVLKPGGTFATTLPSEHFTEYLLGTTVARTLGMPRLEEAYGTFFNTVSHHHHLYPIDEWRRRFDAVGLDLVEFQYYISPEAHRAFDLSHYLGVPNLISRLLFRKWVLHPVQMKPFEWWLRPYYEEPLPEVGAYQFVRCIKRA